MDLLDPPRHAALRRVFRPAFGPAQLNRLQVVAERWVKLRLNSLPTTFDVIEEIARPLPYVVVMELLGVPAEMRTALQREIDVFVNGLGDPAACHPAVSAALTSLRSLISAALARTDLEKGSVLSITKDAIPEAIDFEEAIANVILTVAAGHHTTTNLIGNAVWLLLTHQDERALVAAKPQLWNAAIEEVLRFESPIQTVRRACLDQIEINGQRLNAGAELVLVLGSANRDGDAFDHADRFDVARTPNAHLAFGAGVHACLGAQLARLQAKASLNELFASPALRTVEAEAAWLPSVAVRGLERLIVTRS